MEQAPWIYSVVPEWPAVVVLVGVRIRKGKADAGQLQASKKTNKKISGKRDLRFILFPFIWPPNLLHHL